MIGHGVANDVKRCDDHVNMNFEVMEYGFAYIFPRGFDAASSPQMLFLFIFASFSFMVKVARRNKSE